MPNLLEYEAKRIFRKEGIPIPSGSIASTPDKSREIAETIGKPVVVKVQIPIGGRGRVGGIRFVENKEEIEKVAKELLDKMFRGYKAQNVLIEEKLKIKREMYLGVINDRVAKAPAVMASSEGGMEVEEIALNFPEKLSRVNVNIREGLHRFHARKISKKAGIPRELIGRLSELLYLLYWDVYRKYDAVYTEINPLCLTEDGHLVAADARLYIDDNSMYRHMDIKPEEWEGRIMREKIAYEKGFGYVELNAQGEVACIANGAGLGMSVMDYINEATKDGTLACFLDVGGRFYELAGEALKLVLTLPSLKAVLFHSYGGVTRADTLAECVCNAIKEIKPKIPIFVELSGTGEKEAIEIMMRESPKFREIGITVEWSSHIVSGKEDPSAQKGGVDVIETPVRRVVEWCGYTYRRKPPSWLQAHSDWERVTRKLMKECLAQRPEAEFKELSKYE